jgi:hypothetical protein
VPDHCAQLYDGARAGEVAAFHHQFAANVPDWFLAERAGSKGTREVAGASHALSVSNPDAVSATILDGVAAL